MDTRDINVAIKALKDGKKVGKNGIQNLYCVLAEDGCIYLYKKENKYRWVKKRLFSSLKEFENNFKEGHLFNICEVE